MNNTYDLQVIVPVFNEAEVVYEFHNRLVTVLKNLSYSYMIIYVDDGSNDETASKLGTITDNDEHVCIVQLSRNFGHQAALVAGLDMADARMVSTMDGDGQHPPELIPQLIEKHLEGFDIVQIQRNDENTPSLKRYSASFFYKLINALADTKILPGTADFRLYSYNVVLALRQMPEYHKFIRGMIPWIGFSTYILPYSPEPRIGGRSTYTFMIMIILAENAIFLFSPIPLRLSMIIGFILLLLGLLRLLMFSHFWFRGQQALLAPGWGFF